MFGGIGGGGGGGRGNMNQQRGLRKNAGGVKLSSFLRVDASCKSGAPIIVILLEDPTSV